MKDSKMLKEVHVKDAVGMVLGHDLTQIIPGQFKGRLFKKGHVIREEDIESLLNIGKEHIYIISLEEGYVHEDDAANRMAAAVQGENLSPSEPREGKVNLKTTIHGLAKIDKQFVNEVNAVGEVMMATIANNSIVQPGQDVVGTRAIPLIIDEQKVSKIEEITAKYKQANDGQAPINVKPFRPMKAGVVTTGGEVFTGRIKDKFLPIAKEKMAAFGGEVVEQRFSPDNVDTIVENIEYFLDMDVDIILCSGGMSVDPDDRTPGAIKKAGAEIVSYGTPMLPGSMLLMAYITTKKGRKIPIMGLPGCVLHDPFTVFDVLLPRICAGETITLQDIVELGYGGLYHC